MGIRAYIALVGVGFSKGPAEHPFEVGEAFRACIKGQPVFAAPAKCAHFIKACCVVKVLMGVNDGIYGCEVVAQCLLAQVGAGVDEQGCVPCRDEN